MTEKERLAQALRDGDMDTFTEAIRAANSTADTPDPRPVSQPSELTAALETLRTAMRTDPTDRFWEGWDARAWLDYFDRQSSNLLVPDDERALAEKVREALGAAK